MTLFSIVALVILALGILLGISRGTGKSVIRLISLILAAVATFFVSIPIAKRIADIDISNIESVGDSGTSTLSEYMLTLLKSNETVANIIGDDPTLEAVANQLPVMLLAIATFILSFIVLYLVSLIVYAIFKGPLMRLSGSDKNARPSGGSRIGGAFIGLLSAILCVGMILVPVLGVANMLRNIPEDSNIEAKERYYDPVVDSAVIKAFDKIFFGALGDAYMRNASKVTTEDGEVIYISEETESIIKIYDLLIEYGIVTASAESGGVSLIDSLADGTFTTKLMSLILESKLLSNILKSASYSGGEYIAGLLGLPADDSDAYQQLTDSVASEIDENSENIDISNAYISYENGEYSKVSDDESPAPSGVLGQAPTETVKFNIPGSTTVYMLTVENGEAFIGISDDDDSTPSKMLRVETVLEQVRSVKDSLTEKFLKSVNTDGMTEEQKAVFKASVEGTVDGLISSAAAMISDVNVEYSATFVREFLNAGGYADERLKADSFIYGGVKSGELAAEFSRGIKALIDSEDEDASKTLSDIISPVAQIISAVSDDEGDANYPYIANAIGDIVGAVHGSKALNGLGLTMLEAVSESSAMAGIIPETLTDEIIKIYTDPNADVKQVTSAVASSANIVAALSSGDVDTVEKLVRTLINSLDDGTSELIKSFVTDEFMGKYISNSEDAHNATLISSAVLNVLSGAKDRQSYRDEAEALISLYSLAVNTHTFTPDDLVMLIGYAEKSDIIAAVLHSCNECRVNLSESSKSKYQEAMRRAYTESSSERTPDMQIYRDVADILGIVIDFG